MGTKKPTQVVVKTQKSTMATTSNIGEGMKKVLEARAARFQSAAATSGPTVPVNNVTSAVDQEKFAARAARFADVQASTKSPVGRTTTTTTPAGATTVKPGSTFSQVDPEKLAQRAARFGGATSNTSTPTTATVSVGKVATGGDNDALKKRAERFAKMGAK